MEALAAVGLAGNIVQFVDFSCKLFDQATSIYHSTSGTSRDAEDLESITRNLQDLSVRLSQKNHNQTHPQDHTALKKLAKECETTANELLSALQALKAKKPDSKWNSFRTALASAWKQPRVDALEKRLHTYRSQLIIQLQVLQSNEKSEILHLLDELSGKSQRMGTVVTNQISGLRSEIQYAVKALREDFAQQNSAKTSILVMRESSPAIDISALASKLISSETSGINMVVAVALLDRLTFDQIESRHSQIHKTHPRTFEWVWSNKFEQWVKSPKQLFWISGKPGSGKSTLMKYIVDNPNTHFLLRQWAAPQELVVASYFFWINGSELQRSQEGLLQSVLYELLRQCPDHIESVLPEAWQTMETSKSEGKSSQYAWKKAELLKAFQRLVKLDRNGPRFFIFIDGLDEYKGSHEGLIETISHMSSMGVKICVASRPWNVFEDAFGQDLDCKIYMEELNKPDIELYVNDKLRSRAEFQSMQLSTTDSDEILNEIIDKSHGVFLWVCLVVPSLIEGLRNRDRFSQLQKRLRDFPSDLDEFFGHIFRSLDPTYKIQMAHMFQVALAARDPLSPLAYWFFDEIEDSPDMALSMPVELLQESEFDRRGQEMKIRINGRCKGLLEITSLPNKSLTNHYRVDFLHRTVKDFLMTTETGQRVLNLQQRGFDADLAICKATLAEMKAKHFEHVNSSPLHSFLISAKQYEVKNQKTPLPYLNELQRSMKELMLCRNGTADHFWRTSYESVFTAAVDWDLLLYVKHILHETASSLSNREISALVTATMRASLAMTSLVLSIGPFITIDMQRQKDFQTYFQHREPDELWSKLQVWCRYAAFDMNERGDFAYFSFAALLDGKLAQREIEQLKAILRREGRVREKGGERTAREEKARMKEARKSIFRRIFR